MADHSPSPPYGGEADGHDAEPRAPARAVHPALGRRVYGAIPFTVSRPSMGTRNDGLATLLGVDGPNNEQNAGRRSALGSPPPRDGPRAMETDGFVPESPAAQRPYLGEIRPNLDGVRPSYEITPAEPHGQHRAEVPELDVERDLPGSHMPRAFHGPTQRFVTEAGSRMARGPEYTQLLQPMQLCLNGVFATMSQLAGRFDNLATTVAGLERRIDNVGGLVGQVNDELVAFRSSSSSEWRGLNIQVASLQDAMHTGRGQLQQLMVNAGLDPDADAVMAEAGGAPRGALGGSSSAVRPRGAWPVADVRHFDGLSRAGERLTSFKYAVDWLAEQKGRTRAAAGPPYFWFSGGRARDEPTEGLEVKYALTYISGWVINELESSGGATLIRDDPTWDTMKEQLRLLFADGTDQALRERELFTSTLYQGAKAVQTYNSKVNACVRQFQDAPGYGMATMDLLANYRAGLSNVKLYQKLATDPSTNHLWTADTPLEALSNCMQEAVRLEQFQNETYGPQKPGDKSYRSRAGGRTGGKGQAASGSGAPPGGGKGQGSYPSGGGGKRSFPAQGGAADHKRPKWQAPSGQQQGARNGPRSDGPPVVKCFNCQGFGHKADVCPTGKGSGAQPPRNGGAGPSAPHGKKK